MSNQRKVIIPRDKIAEFCKRNHIQRLSLFGSVIRGEVGSDSDIDILVEFKKGNKPGFLGLAKLERELSQLLSGEKVDLRTPEELSKYFRDEVLSKAEVQYAEG